MKPPLPRLDLPVSDFSENREESKTAEPLCTDDTAPEAPDAQNAQCTPYAPGTCKSTHENFGKPAKSFSDFYLKRHYCTWISGYQLVNVELLTLHLFCSVLIWIGTKHAKFKTFSVTIIVIEHC